MHLLPVTAISLDEGGEATDLQQPPGDIVVLSFADSDLGALAAAHRLKAGGATLRLASLRRLRHPLSVDLYIEKTAAKARETRDRLEGELREVSLRRSAAEERFADRDRERTAAWGLLTRLRAAAERIGVRAAGLGDLFSINILLLRDPPGSRGLDVR